MTGAKKQSCSLKTEQCKVKISQMCGLRFFGSKQSNTKTILRANKGSEYFSESLILAQDERWRRA